ncbi:hypothetical protein BWQ96_02648 [Gracilariopsis chorda]|uniref:Uncharacterized protein n=1 Tax=Gracilariopsis chorda TaxID=448386 RepID=A0A2V3IZD5_9FLOR|nr:hypothetical protein BWQ96_02648 [Gracilariopsis chorda]|eukprot:PXF47504.1 hypothetical protein BWQ96_02648 [Gracilariopsis chorda]
MAIDSQGNLIMGGPLHLDRNPSEFSFVKRHRNRWTFDIKYKHVPGLYPRLFSVLSGIKISKHPEAKAVTESGVVASRYQTDDEDATILILEETLSSPYSDKASCLRSIIVIIDKNKRVSMPVIHLEYEDGILHRVNMSERSAIDYCENWMSDSFRRRDPYNTIASVALSLGVYLSDVQQECLKKLTNLQAGNLEQTHKHDVGNITIGDLIAAGMAKWGSSRLYNDIAKCCFVYENGQFRVVEESTKPKNKHKLEKKDVDRVPRGI